MYHIAWALARIPVVGSAVVNGFFYYTLGYGDILPWIFAATFFAIDCAKPELFRTKRNRVICRLGGCVLVIGSLTAAAGLFVQHRGDMQKRLDDAEARIVEIRSELATIPSVGSVVDLEQAVKDEAADGGCLSKCRALQTELGQARRRDKLESEIAVIQQSKPRLDAQAEALAQALETTPLIAAAIVAGLLAVVLETASVLTPMAVPERSRRVKLPEHVTDLEKVRALAKTGMTQTQIAEAMKISQATVSRRLNGR